MSTVEQFFIKRSTGFFYNITLTEFNRVRYIEIIDKEVLMGDKEPSDTFILSFSDDEESNVDQLRSFAEKILDMTGGVEKKEIMNFTEWLFHTTEDGFTPYEFIVNKNNTIEELYKLWKSGAK